MTGEIPTESPIQPERLNLHRLTGEIPTELGNLSNLSNLDRGDTQELGDLSTSQLQTTS